MDGHTETSTDIPDTKEVLGDHLYQKVWEVCQGETISPTLPRKVTGMLMECRTKDILLMLTDDRLLQKHVCAARSVLPGTDTVNQQENTEEKVDLGSRLFEKISKLESCLCAQITGMLLELDCTTLEGFLNDEEKLRLAVEKSKTTFLKHKLGRDIADIHNGFTREEVTMVTDSEIGEQLYDIIEPYYPDEASRITGMLLEMEESALRTLIHNKPLLWEKVSLAQQALLNVNDSKPLSCL